MQPRRSLWRNPVMACRYEPFLIDTGGRFITASLYASKQEPFLDEQRIPGHLTRRATSWMKLRNHTIHLWSKLCYLESRFTAGEIFQNHWEILWIVKNVCRLLVQVWRKARNTFTIQYFTIHKIIINYYYKVEEIQGKCILGKFQCLTMGLSRFLFFMTKSLNFI